MPIRVTYDVFGRNRECVDYCSSGADTDIFILLHTCQFVMATNIEDVHKELKKLRADVDFVKHLLLEEHELSDEARAQLDDARKTPESEYVDLV